MAKRTRVNPTDGRPTRTPRTTNVLVTGSPRSGTTLTERLLDAHPQATIASQPFPLLYQEVMRLVFSRYGASGVAYPLGNPLGQRPMSVADLNACLSEVRLEAGWLRACLERMRGYSGCWTPEVIESAGQFDGGGFTAIQADIARVANLALGRRPSPVMGTKEVLLAEFLPALLAAGTRAVLVVRDPRAVIASLYARGGRHFGGARRPVLFHLRTWRSSVAYALELANEPGLIVLRYEDIVDDLTAAAARLHDHVGLTPLTQLGRLLDQHGRPFTGNSSFSSPREAGSASWRGDLDSTTIRYIEATCLPELLALGYQPTARALYKADLASYVEALEIEVDDLPADFSHAAASVAEEVRRLDLLLARADPSADDGTPAAGSGPLRQAIAGAPPGLIWWAG